MNETIENQNKNLEELEKQINDESDETEKESLNDRLDLIKKQIKDLEEKKNEYSKKEKKLTAKLETEVDLLIFNFFNINFEVISFFG